jgi:type IX secretion system PorP/SprF family membrane protein
MNTMKKYLVTVVLSCLSVISIFAQHELAPSLSSQMFSRINYNPAGMGNSGNVNIFSQTRFQWVGFGDGAPKSEVLNVHGFVESIKSGFGGTFTYDAIGLGRTNINAKVAYAYNLDLSDRGLLSFGLSAGIHLIQKTYDRDLIGNYGNEESVSAGLINESKINPDVAFGIEYSHPYFLVGASINHIGMLNKITTFSPTQTYYVYARGSIPVAGGDWHIAPSVLYMNSGQANVVNLSCIGYYRGFESEFGVKDLMCWGGLGFNLNDFSAAPYMPIMLGVEWTFLRVGYAYELGFGIGNYNTHEVMLSFNIPTASKKSAVDSKKKKKKRR